MNSRMNKIFTPLYFSIALISGFSARDTYDNFNEHLHAAQDAQDDYKFWSGQPIEEWRADIAHREMIENYATSAVDCLLSTLLLYGAGAFAAKGARQILEDTLDRRLPQDDEQREQ